MDVKLSPDLSLKLTKELREISCVKEIKWQVEAGHSRRVWWECGVWILSNLI